MKQQILKITGNVPLTDSVYMMTLEGPELEEQKPGQLRTRLSFFREKRHV